MPDDDRNGGSDRFMPRSPDPSHLTTEAVARATDVFRREIQALKETLETRLTGADMDRDRIWERVRELPELYETFTSHLRDELIQRDTHDREVIEQRLISSDKAVELLAGETARVQAAAEQGDEQGDTEMRALVQALRELIMQRLDSMDVATRVLAGSVAKFPSDTDRATANVREVLLAEIKRVQAVTDEKFTAIDGTFSSNALALTAALSAAKEAVSEQNKTNSQAIAKSETATKEQLASLSRVTDAGIAGLEDKIADARDRLTKIESLTRGIDQAGETSRSDRNERRADTVQQHSSTQLVIAGIAGLLSMIAIVVTIVLATRHGA